MGVRLYHPATGRFLQTDQVAGGSASAYDYCNADPVNCTDLAGTFSWKGLVKAVAVVGEVASVIPGPVGAVAAGLSTVAYAASGNKGKALEMAGTIVAAAVGAGAVLGAVKAVKIARAAAPAVKTAIRVAKSNRAVLSNSKVWSAAFKSKTFGAKSKLFGDVYSGAAKPGVLNRGRVQIGWSGARVAKANGRKVARTVFRIAIKGPSGKSRVHFDIGWGPYRSQLR